MTALDDRHNTTDAPRRLVRIHKDRKIAGVCTGFGVYFNLDPTLIRLLWILLVIAGGSGILLYLIAWIIMPLDESR
jgi:phage shock protein PspC (stress-responsive transcriptional regulator)